MSWLIKINPFAWLAPSQARQGYEVKRKQRDNSSKGRKPKDTLPPKKMPENKVPSKPSSGKANNGRGSDSGQGESGGGGKLLPIPPSMPIKPTPIVPQPPLPNESTDMNSRNEQDDASAIGAGSPWLAYLLSFLAVLYIALLVLVWVGQEKVFQKEYGKVPKALMSQTVSEILPDIIYQKKPSRFIVAKILCIYYSYPLIIMVVYLLYIYCLTALHWLGCICNRVQYLLPKSRLSTIVFVTELAPSFGILSSCWGLMSRGSTTAQYSKFVTLGPTYIGIFCLLLGLIYLNIVPKLKQVEVVS